MFCSALLCVFPCPSMFWFRDYNSICMTFKYLLAFSRAHIGCMLLIENLQIICRPHWFCYYVFCVEKCKISCQCIGWAERRLLSPTSRTNCLSHRTRDIKLRCGVPRTTRLPWWVASYALINFFFKSSISSIS